jgi:hypothetical protein
MPHAVGLWLDPTWVCWGGWFFILFFWSLNSLPTVLFFTHPFYDDGGLNGFMWI